MTEKTDKIEGYTFVAAFIFAIMMGVIGLLPEWLSQPLINFLLRLFS